MGTKKVGTTASQVRLNVLSRPLFSSQMEMYIEWNQISILHQLMQMFNYNGARSSCFCSAPMWTLLLAASEEHWFSAMMLQSFIIHIPFSEGSTFVLQRMQL